MFICVDGISLLFIGWFNLVKRFCIKKLELLIEMMNEIIVVIIIRFQKSIG